MIKSFPVYKMKWSLIFTFLCCYPVSFSQVLELDDRFEDLKGERNWLIEFYAPWCGHCKKLEPIYHQVSVILKSAEPDIIVAKVDATRFSSSASTYDVRGYPTIKFIHGSGKVFTHTGDRSKEGIVEFAKRAKGPYIRTLSNIGKYNDFKNDHPDQVFFMYIGDQDEHGDLFGKYKDLSEKYAVLSYFCAGTKKSVPQGTDIKNDPTVLVFKDKTSYEYMPEDGIVTMHSLEVFINEERFSAFPKINSGGLNELADTKKKIVILVIDEKSKERKADNIRVKSVAEKLSLQKRETYHSTFQFMWMDERDTVENLVMSSINPPFIMILDSVSHYYFLPNVSASKMTMDDMEAFMKDVMNDIAQPWGGTGVLQRFKRLFYDIITTIIAIWSESPWLALLVFGVPSIVISIVCYALCCMETSDETYTDDEDEEEDGERLEDMGGDGDNEKNQPESTEGVPGHLKSE